ncbi:hypothetical protein DACRYDRAFT_116836 [Dacryopinax primogenitus]|uniref:BTB domain-containing protein n=1 Tax=Dacryopinax primogenitus (strain DJM 731) TaxID=1858805 RepID=M5G578_DACPD|nr:uncharacterized protein DACRYDRAFT_116836 [Dacryopinax primogenitus]EJU00987.1 hypothetical protein DACRYDRAFT_116836 [Dacryopinax primogenitus]
MATCDQASYSCPDADLTIRSSLDGSTFPARSKSLISASAVFDDMFTICTPSDNPTIDVLEASDALLQLLQFIHYPPNPYSAEDSPLSIETISSLLTMADKYQFKSHFLDTIHTHLSAHIPWFPMQVYALATRWNIPDMADQATAYLHHPPLSKWPESIIKSLPSAQAYHEVLRLQAHRTEKFREILLTEDIFPHGYGNCILHGPATTKLWERARRTVATRLDAGSDVGEEMQQCLLTSVAQCNVCGMALNRAVDMLKYKCARVAKVASRVPPEAS